MPSADLYRELREREVLVVEEDPWIRDALATFFAVEGVRCTALGSVEKGLEALRERAFDVIVCEHWLEGADGLWFLKFADDAHPDAIKVLITAYPTEEVRAEAGRHPSVFLLPKPFRIETLEDLLEREIAERGRRRGPVRAVAARREEPPDAARFAAGVAQLVEGREEETAMGKAHVGRLIPDPDAFAPAAAGAGNDVSTIVVTDAGGTVISVNEAFEAYEGYSRYEVLGKNAADLRNGARDRYLYRTIWYLARRNALGVEAPSSRREPAGPGTVNVFPLRDSLDRVTHFVAVRRKAAGRGPRRRAAVESSFPARLRRLAAGVAHNVDSRLRFIGGCAEILMSRAGEGGSEELRSIGEAAERIASITRRLLAYAQMQETRPERTELGAFVSCFMDELAAAEGIGLRRELAPDLGAVSIDRKLFGHVLADLVEHARGRMAGGGTLTLRAANVDLQDSFVRQEVYIRRGRYVMVSVHHDGEGPAEEAGARIFEPFSAGLQEPPGLLLPAVYGAVKQSGGYIWAFTREGNGTTFNIYLPRVDAE